MPQLHDSLPSASTSRPTSSETCFPRWAGGRRSTSFRRWSGIPGCSADGSASPGSCCRAEPFPWTPFAGKLFAGKLPARDRELVVLRTGWRTQAAYEWGQHVGIARDAGISDEEIRCIVAGPSAPGWTSQDAAVLRAVDELDGEHCISDATWNDLSETLDERQMIELTMLSGHYAMLAGTLNSLGVQAERSLPGLGEL